MREERSQGGHEDTADRLAEDLIERGWTISTAESCTGGGLAQRLTDRPGSSAYFIGSIVAYHNRVKQELLAVTAETIERHGAVSAQTANQMARACRERFRTDIAVAITGIAGPGGGTPEKPVGLVFVSVATKDTVTAHVLRLPGDRAAVRRQTVCEALRLAVTAVLAFESSDGILNVSEPTC